ncbi:hypothetical protein H4F46_06365 [Pectobacterium brasiliense]|uniref:hypothetical protein n=1 Tax=Pectobacterium TaxID=122277 RepID=UPI0019692290|nr:hypothetical protein [Pectobacterium brasiliense]MBN3114523.1 hypothetical protein [Pectobacterium brasiliense]
MLNFKKELNALISELVSESNDFAAKNLIYNGHGSIYHSFHNQSKLFNEKAINFVEKYIKSDLFFTEIQTSLISNLESKLAEIELKLKENKDRIKQLEYKKNILFNGFFGSLSNVKGKRDEIKFNLGTINSYRSTNKNTVDMINDLKNKIKRISETTSISDISFFFREECLPNFLSRIPTIKKPAEDKIEYISKFFFIINH